MKSHFRLLVMSIFVAALNSAAGQGTMITLHSGYNDPTSEGFNLGLASTSVGPVTNDLGMNAWTTAVPTNGLYALYSEGLSANQTALLSGQNWVLSLNLRVVGVDTSGRTWVNFGSGSDEFSISFGAGTNGDPFVQIGHQSYTLNGVGSTYNNYQLVYDATSDMADLYIDGVDRISDVTHTSLLESAGALYFGSGTQAGPAQANWNLISLNVPEPSSAAVLLLGGGALFYFRRKYLH